ncbi:MAG: hypothetical protein AAF541_11140 [Pseudomonadota bacterium]
MLKLGFALSLTTIFTLAPITSAQEIQSQFASSDPCAVLIDTAAERTSFKPDTSYTSFNAHILQRCAEFLSDQIPTQEVAVKQSILAWRYADIGDFERGKTVVDAIPPAFQSNPVVLNNIANTLLKQSQYNQALAMYDDALKLSPASDQLQAIQKNRSLALRGLGRYLEANAAFQASRPHVPANPASPEGRFDLDDDPDL